MPPPAAAAALVDVCAAPAWATAVAARRPFGSLADLRAAAAAAWAATDGDERRAALDAHPRIGGGGGGRHPPAALRQAAAHRLAADLDAANAAYEARFGYGYLVCAAGKSGAALLADVRSRLGNEPAVEVEVAAAEEAKITALRLGRLVEELGATADGGGVPPDGGGHRSMAPLFFFLVGGGGQWRGRVKTPVGRGCVGRGPNRRPTGRAGKRG
ncbi:hypothetical protein BU14_0085s0025 [Porphyra umbilicalis]|uniref:2-oxo-4-hydroxy-4-carboxy-5-ureidoimidazoline decarboxylase n=1 Tax=Porphyra umbilicalis TaxID=2786 RepID=A0A1X6PE97_PORUM|nr:hypothetical protein BU14_0085s0025 [Porphyra umbilicalis]|eukprot:OSX79174.1 hypothetical protein BU14_0085s0025 [Porphyra umbilicalis]